jgi:hypothetical protein
VGDFAEGVIMTADHKIPGFSDADMTAIDVLVSSGIATNKAIQELARAAPPTGHFCATLCQEV